MKKIIVSFLLISSIAVCYAQREIELYQGAIPNSITTEIKEERLFDPVVDSLVVKVITPTLTVYHPSPKLRNGTAVIICPGGGYHCLLINREGRDVAKAFNKLGVTAFVLKYRLPNIDIFNDRSTAPLQDAQRAIQMVRERADELQINKDKIGIMGFSAGGHLAASAGVHFDDILIDNLQNISLRPDFMILINPVISFSDRLGHQGSLHNLLGDDVTTSQINYFSNEEHVKVNTPITFLTHAGDDTVVSPENSLIFYNKLRSSGIQAEFHMFSTGEHGFLKEPSFQIWFGLCADWMRRGNLIKITTDQ